MSIVSNTISLADGGHHIVGLALATGHAGVRRIGQRDELLFQLTTDG